MSYCSRSCISRRRFLQVAGSTAGCLMLLPLQESLVGAALTTRTPIFPKSKARVLLVFSHMPSGNPTWPAKDYNYDAVADKLARRLYRECPGIEFTVRHAANAEQGQALVQEAGDIDGFVVYNIGIWTGVPNVIAHSGKPVVMVDDLFAGSGETLITNTTIRNEKLPVVTVASSDFSDVVSAVRLFEVIRAMKDSTILDVVDYDIAPIANQVETVYGASLIKMDSKELASYYDRASVREATEWADMWIANAKAMREPTREEVVKSGRMYLALCKAASDKKADAVTVDCLGMFYSGRITAYPCLSHFQMNNDGGTGVCEGDVNSTCTQLMMRYMTGRPGYVSDPVIDTSRSEIIYAHCVAHNRAFGPKGKANPYIIRSHAEDGKGASVQSLLPIGEDVTTLEFDIWSKRAVVHTGRTTRNVDEPKACRTKLAARTNAQAILDNWDMGWHRVTVFGDWRKQVKQLARLYGFSIFEEDKA
jgi:L-fucose isomerase-like protein